MSQHWIEDTVREYVSSLRRHAKRYRVHACKQSERLLCCLSSPCLVVFFSIVPRSSRFEAFLAEVEDEIRAVRDENKWEYMDLNLILLLQQPEGPNVISDLRHSTILCRKFVFFPIDPTNLRNQLAYLPFSPLDTGGALSLRVLSLSPEMLLKRSGASERFARSLISHRPGVQSLSRMITKNDYVLTDKASVEATVTEEYDQPRSQLASQYGVSLEKVLLENFRGIGRKVDFHFGGAITVLFGINGTGKTSVCDAIEWAVTGSVARVERPDVDAKQSEAERSVINYFASSPRASVELTLNTAGSYVKRSVNGNLTQTVSASEGDNDWGSIQAATQSLRRTGLDLRRAREAFRSSHFLQQSTIREFLDRDPVERFEALSRILGYEELVHLTRKLRSVRSAVEDDVRKREPLRADAEQKLREREAEASAIEKSIKHRETALSSQPASDRMFSEVVAEANACDLPTPEPPEVLSPATMKQWLTDANEVLTAVDNSLKESLNKTGDALELAVQVEAERKDINELKPKMSTLASEEKKRREKAGELDGRLSRTATDSKNTGASLDSQRRELAALQWVSSHSVTLRQEETTLKAEQQDLVHLDGQIHGRQVELQKLEDLLNNITAQVDAKIQEVKRAEARRSALEELLKLRHDWSRAVASIAELERSKQHLSESIVSQEKEIERVRANRIEAHDNHITLRKQAEAEEALNSRRSQLLAELRQTMSRSEKACPFCGFEYANHQDLLTHMERVEETPTSVYRLVLSKAEEARKKLASVDDELMEKENLLESLSHRTEEHTKEINVAKIQLMEIRDKASVVGFLPKDADDTFVPKEAQLRDALEEVGISSLLQDLEGLKLEEEDSRSKIARAQEILGELTAKRQSTATVIEERQRRVSTLRSQASDEAALDLLALPESEVQARISRVQERIEETTGLMRETEVIQHSLEQEKASVLQEADDLQQQVKQWQDRLAVASQREDSLRDLLLSIGISDGQSQIALREFQRDLEARIGRITQLHKRCSILSDILQLEASRVELAQAKKNLDREKKALAKITKEIRAIMRKLAEIDHVSSTFQELTVVDMTDTLKALSAPLNSIFERLNGHPLFGALRIEPDEKSKTVTFRVETPNPEDRSDMETTVDLPPRSYLSDAQLNIVALSIFLSIALYQTWSKFKLIVIDDPVQQMDDLNAASFIDLIREVAVQNGRQFVITTCNYEFYKLALNKLSCLNTRDVTLFRAYRLEGLRREGPEIITDAPYWDNDEVRSLQAQ